MINFTRTPDTTLNRLVNKKIQNDINSVCDQVKSLLGKDLYAVLLCGGFGRGEGSVTIKGKNVHIVNDYDFTVVLNARNNIHYLWLYKKFHAQLEDLAQKIAMDLDIKQLDLSLKPISYFKKTTLKIENYEVKKGHVLVYGKDNPTWLMPNFKASDIPLFEGTWLFRNRGLGLILAALYFTTSSKISDDKKENFIIECNKAQMAMGDAALLMKKNYHHLYRQRLKIAQKSDFSHFPNAKDLKRRYIHALGQKLQPNFSQYDNMDLNATWFDIRTAFLSFFRFFEQKRLGTAFQSWTEYADIKSPENQFDLKSFSGKLIRSARDGVTPKSIKTCFQKSRLSHSIRLVALILSAIDKDGFNLSPMHSAARRLNLILSGDQKQDWLRLASALIHEIHPTGEAGRVISA